MLPQRPVLALSNTSWAASERRPLVHKSATRNVRQPASCRTLLQDRSCTSGGHGEKMAAKTSTHAHTVPPWPPTTTAAAKTRATTHVRPPVMQRGRQRSRRPLPSTRADVSLPALQQRPLATMAAAGTYADARGSCLGFEQVTAPGPMPSTLQPRQMVRKWGLP